jgi:EpsG family
MLLSSFVLFIFLLSIVSYVLFSIHTNMLAAGPQQANWRITAISVLLCLVVATAISLRNPFFGVDTKTYVGIFNSYCVGGTLHDSETSFIYSVKSINAFMLGACDSRYLPYAWVAFMVMAFFAAREKFNEKTIYLAIFLTSMIGIELTTNALRQGFSIALLVSALSYYKNNNLFAAIFAVGAVALHSSSALVIFLFFLCSLQTRAFLACIGILSFLLVTSLKSGITLFVTSRFIYEVQKYLEHDADEIAIRMLAFACVLCVVVLPVIVSSTARLALWKSRNYNIAIKLLLVCIPFLYLPYFGYRLIYGTFPIVLWLVITRLLQVGKLTPSIFMILILTNLTIIWIWSAGSSYMRSITFLG